MSVFSRLSVLCLLAVTASACGSTMWLDRSQDAFRRGELVQAFKDLETAKAEGEDPEEVERLWWPYRTAYLLKQAQYHCFANDDVRALEDLAKVLAVEPDNPIALAWTRKCRERLAARATAEADRHLSDGELEAALIDYHEALTFWPGHPPAEEGLRKVSDNWKERREKADARYIEGVRALAEQLFAQTEYHMLVALEADPTHERAAASKREAVDRLTELRFERAREMEEAGYFEAALRDYQDVQKHSPEWEGIDERVVFVEREVEASKLARKGELELFRGNYAKAREHIDKAFELSVARRPHYNDLLLMTRDREFEEKYVIAKDLEYQGEYEDAVKRYTEIAEAVPSFLDVKARLHELQASLEAAQEAYDAAVAAEQAGKADEAISLFKDTLLHAPKYRDARDRLKLLQAAQEGSADTTNDTSEDGSV